MPMTSSLRKLSQERSREYIKQVGSRQSARQLHSRRIPCQFLRQAAAMRHGPATASSDPLHFATVRRRPHRANDAKYSLGTPPSPRRHTLDDSAFVRQELWWRHHGTASVWAQCEVSRRSRLDGVRPHRICSVATACTPWPAPPACYFEHQGRWRAASSVYKGGCS